MKFTRIAISILLVTTLTLPAMASSGWVEDFLRRYDPSAGVATSTTNTAPDSMGQFLRTGEIPVTLSDVINLMIDNNLDIRSNRFSPRSSYWQSLVFYRSLQPSIRFAFNRNQNTTMSTNQINGTIPDVSQLRTNYTLRFTQALATGTSVAVDASLNRTASTSNFNLFNPSYNSQLTYTVGQHLLRDRGRLPNTRQILIGQNNEKMSEVAFEI